MNAIAHDEAIKRYPRVLRLFHWTLALLVATQFALILVFHSLQSLEFGKVVLDLHRQVGTAVLVLIIARLVMYGFVRTPPSDSQLPFWQRAAAFGVHVLVLLALAAQPVLGMVTAWARGDEVSFFHIFTVPMLVQVTNEQGVTMEAWHRWLAYGLLTLLAVHIGAVMFNHIVRKVSIIERMLAAPPANKLTNRVPVLIQLCLCCCAILALALGSGIYGAQKYSEFNALHAQFDDGDVATLDELRSTQLSARSLGAAPAADAVAALGTSMSGTLPKLKDPSVRHDASAAARAFTAAAAGGSVSLDRLTQANTSLDSTVDNMALAVFQRRLELVETASQGHDLIVLTLAPTVFISAVIAFLLSRSILNVLAQARLVVRLVGAGQIAGSVEIKGKGEFAALMEDINTMSHDVLARERENHEREAEKQALIVTQVGIGMSRLAAGDLTFRLDQPFAGGADQIRRDFNNSISELEVTMRIIQRSSDEINSNSVSVASASRSLARRTERQATSLNDTVHGISRMADALKTSSEGAADAANFVTSARAVADQSRGIVAQTIQAMANMEESGRQIIDVVATIDNIAFQTNILALNAGVEAARVGDVGAGFAIVAGEVRALAKRAAQAADDVRDLIHTSNTNISDSAGLVRKTSTALQQIIDQVGSIDTLVHDIAGSVEHQAKEVQHINKVIKDLDSVVQENAAMAEEASAALSLIRGNSDQLDELVGQFRVADDAALAVEDGHAASAPTQGHRSLAA